MGSRPSMDKGVNLSILILDALVQKGILTKKEARAIYQSESPVSEQTAESTRYIWDQYYDDGSLD